MEHAQRGWWPFAYTILDEIGSNCSPEDELLVDRLYRSMAGGDRIYKITHRGRFDELDERIAQGLAEFSRRGRPVTIHDVAASNGITTVELFERLSGMADVEVTGSDSYDGLSIVRTGTSGWTCVFDNGGRCLQIIGYGFVLSGYRPEPARYFGNRLLQKLLLSRVVPRASELLRRAGIGESGSVRELRLWHPKALLAAERDSRLRFVRHDLFQEAPFRACVVRALNILTTHHFPLGEVRRGIEACFRSTTSGGLLVLGRCVDEEDGRTRATAYRKQEDGTLAALWRVNEGYEHDDLVRGIHLRERVADHNVTRTQTVALR